MKANKKTNWEEHQEMRLQRELPNVKWVARVKNFVVDKENNKGAILDTEFTSENCDLDGVAHKVKLDLITNLLNKFEEPILVQIKKI